MIINISGVTKSYRIHQRDERDDSLKGNIINIFKKSYRNLDAVKNLNLSVDKGELIGYIGVNGAGKSTTIKMLTGILVPTEGEISVFDKNPYKYRKEIAKKIGVVFGQRSQLIWDIPPIDTFNLFSKIYEIPRKQYVHTLNYMVDYMEIRDLLDIPVRKLSLGQRMCCEIVASLLHNPEILFLDEPTIGLDILNKEKIINFIKKINEDYKTTIILTTHDLGDLEKLCNRVLIIDKGSAVYDDSLDKIKNEYGSVTTLKIDFLSRPESICPNYEDIECWTDYKTNSLFIKYDKRKYATPDLLNYVIKKSNYIRGLPKTTSKLRIYHLFPIISAQSIAKA